MKIALIHIRYIYKGGLETRLFNYIEYFLNRGDEVHLFTSKISPDIKIPDGLIIHLINLKIIPKPVRNFFFNKRLKKRLRRKEYDFILSLERTSRQFHVIAPSTHKGYLVAKRSKLYDLVDMLQIYLDKQAFMKAKIVYACSEMIKNEIHDFYKINSNNIKVLYPPVNLAKFKPDLDKNMARNQLNLHPGNKYFVLVSTSHKRKGLDLLLDVFADLPSNYHLLIAGTKIDSSLNNIHSLGFVKDMNTLYAAADYLLHPAVYEPFGQIITEAFACRVPVLVSERVGAKELVNDTNGILVPKLSKQAWQAAILSLEGKNFSFEGIEDVLEELSLESHMRKMLNWAILKN
ncbi:MAG: glycosyltransferase family 4 protein [Chitinophagales bacterium]